MAVERAINISEAVSNTDIVAGDTAFKGLGAGSRKAADHLFNAWGHLAALSIGYGINAFVGYRDYKYEQHRLRGFYEAEVAAQLGKSPASVGVADLKTVAQKNPVIASALRRNKANRLLEFGVSCIGVTAAVILTSAALVYLGFPAAVFSAGSVFTGAAIGFGIFYPCEKLLEHVGRKVFGLHQPGLNQVARNPALQRELSAPGQVRFLAQMQGHVNPRDPKSFIRPEQVMTAFLAINPKLDTTITQRYGVPFADLKPETQMQVMQELGVQMNIFQLTDDLNSRTVRAQEVAFAAFGDASGVPPLDSPRVNALQEKLAAAQQKIGALTQAAKEKTAEAAHTVGDKIKHCFGKSQVSGVVPANQNMANAAMIPMEGQISVGSNTQRILAQRQQQALNQTTRVGA